VREVVVLVEHLRRLVEVREVVVLVEHLRRLDLVEEPLLWYLARRWKASTPWSSSRA
jgi:hypothetical protein